MLGSTFIASLISTTFMEVYFFSRLVIRLEWVGSRWGTRMKAMPGSGGIFWKNFSKASSPPAEAPIPATGNRSAAEPGESAILPDSRGWPGCFRPGILPKWVRGLGGVYFPVRAPCAGSWSEGLDFGEGGSDKNWKFIRFLSYPPHPRPVAREGVSGWKLVFHPMRDPALGTRTPKHSPRVTI